MSDHSLIIQRGTVVDGTGQAQTGGPGGARPVARDGGPEVVAA